MLYPELISRPSPATTTPTELRTSDRLNDATSFDPALEPIVENEELAALVTAANADGDVIGSVCHGALGLVNAKDTDGTPLIEGRTVTGVTDTQIDQLGISITPKHPETELRAAKGNFVAQTAFRDMFATHVAVDGNLVTGQNQNSGAETAHRMLEILAR